MGHYSFYKFVGSCSWHIYKHSYRICEVLLEGGLECGVPTFVFWVCLHNVSGAQRVMGLMAGLDLNACVTSLSFSSTGSLLLASSRNCPKVFLYEVGSGVLISYFQLTMNRLLEGISRELNSKFITDGGEATQRDREDLDFKCQKRRRVTCRAYWSSGFGVQD